MTIPSSFDPQPARERRAAVIHVTEQLFERLLRLPDDVRVTGLGFDFPRLAVSVRVEGERFDIVSAGTAMPELDHVRMEWDNETAEHRIAWGPLATQPGAPLEPDSAEPARQACGAYLKPFWFIERWDNKWPTCVRTDAHTGHRPLDQFHRTALDGSGFSTSFATHHHAGLSSRAAHMCACGKTFGDGHDDE